MQSLRALSCAARLLQLSAVGSCEGALCFTELRSRMQLPVQQLISLSNYQPIGSRTVNSRCFSVSNGDGKGDQDPDVSSLESTADVAVDTEEERELTPEEQIQEAMALLHHDMSSTNRPRQKPRRKDIGSYADYEEEIDEELADVGVHVPEDVPIYDLRDAAPHLWEPSSPHFEELLKYGQENLGKIMEQMGFQEEPAPYPGARQILRWEVNLVLDTSGMPSHPGNRKAKCRVLLRDLQQETGLTDDALKHIALVAGSRYNPNKGELTLTSEKTPDREENRRHIMDMLHALVDEGKRAYPAAEPEAANA